MPSRQAIPIEIGKTRCAEVAETATRTTSADSVAYATRLLIPATAAGIAVRNTAMHLMPLVNGAARLGMPRGKWHSQPGIPPQEYSFAATRWEKS